MLRLRNAIIFLLLLVPAFQLALKNQDIPHFGFLHDDALYFVASKAIAQGDGLIIPSLPTKPAETKFPPGQPLFHALSWIIEPNFPANLRVALWLQWLWLPLCLWIARKVWRIWGFDEWTGWALTASLALNAFVLFGAVTLLTELPFLCFLLTSLLLARKAEQNPDREFGWAVLAGAAAAAAFLFRSIGMFLLAGFPLVMAYRRRWSAAISYAVPLLFVIIGWHLFVRASLVPGPPGEIYYTSYFGYHTGGFQFDDIPSLIWGNLDGVSLSMGGTLLPAQSSFPFLTIVVRAIGIMSVIGIVRLVRRGIAVDYALFSLAYFGMLMIWHLPNQRIIVPMLPLMIAGMAAEFHHIGSAIIRGFKHVKRDQRIASYGLATASVLLIFWMTSSHWRLIRVDLQELFDAQGRHMKQEQQVYGWVRNNLPRDAKVLTGEDPLFYLYTDRLAVRTLVPLRHWYRPDTEAGVYKIYANLDSYARANKLNYVYWGLRSPMPSSDMMGPITKSLFQNQGLQEIYRHPGGTVFRVKETSAPVELGAKSSEGDRTSHRASN